MKVLGRYLGVPLAAAALTGCAVFRHGAIMHSWERHHYSELILSWGPPQHVYIGCGGDRIFIYTVPLEWRRPETAATRKSATAYDDLIWGKPEKITDYRPPHTRDEYSAWRMVVIDADGFINGSWSTDPSYGPVSWARRRCGGGSLIP